MANINDCKPRIILNEYKLSENLPSGPTTLDERWTINKFKKKFKVVIQNYQQMEMEFDLIGIHPFLANTFRRLMISEVPSMAIEKVHIINNTSIMQDEVLAHRLGLIPIKADPRVFEFHSEDSSESNEQETLEFELKVKCSWNKDANKDSACPDDIYKNYKVLSKHIKWRPIGNQAELYSESTIGPVDDDILITKMRPGHEIDAKLIAIKSIGKDHAKFSPVCTAYYRLLPEIHLTREVDGEAAERLQKCFSPGVISIKHKNNGYKFAVVANARYDMGSRNIFRYDDLKDAAVMTKIQDHFIFTVESVGAWKPEDIFVEAVKVLRKKCSDLLEELHSY